MSASKLNTLLEDINSRIAQNLAYPKVKYFEQAFLQTKNDQTFPLVNKGNGKGFQISINDSALQCYHRVIDSETETDYEGGKGKFPFRTRVYTIRNVWLGNIRKLPAKVYENTDDVKNDVYNAFPTILTNKEIIKTNNENINKKEILDEEFDGSTFDYLSLELVVFYIEYEIRQKIKCN